MAVKKKPVSIRDVAKKAGVSRSTVSLVLNNSPVPKAETRRKVLEAVRQLKYQLDPSFGQAMRRHQAGKRGPVQMTQTIGFFANDFLLSQARVGDGYYSRVLAGIQQAVEKHDYHLMLKTLGEDEVAPPAMVTEGRVDGLVIEGDLPPMLLKLLKDRTPIALIDRCGAEMNVDSVMPNIETAVHKQLDYLWELGHRNIIKFTSVKQSVHNRLYERAFRQFFENRGHPNAQPHLCESHAIEVETHDQVMAQFAAQIAEANPRPTALITWDIYACSLLPLLQERGLRVPEDISIIGMDDTLKSQMAAPQLSTHRFPMEDMGRSATELLLERIQDRNRPTHQLQISGKLIERATCASVAAP